MHRSVRRGRQKPIPAGDAAARYGQLLESWVEMLEAVNCISAMPLSRAPRNASFGILYYMNIMSQPVIRAVLRKEIPYTYGTNSTSAGPYRTVDLCPLTMAASSGPQNSGGPGFFLLPRLSLLCIPLHRVRDSLRPARPSTVPGSATRGSSGQRCSGPLGSTGRSAQGAPRCMQLPSDARYLLARVLTSAPHRLLKRYPSEPLNGDSCKLYRSSCNLYQIVNLFVNNHARRSKLTARR